MTQKALQEIMLHLDRLSSESDQKIKNEAQALSLRVSGDIAQLNAQMTDLKKQKELLGNENYARLLEILQQMDEKLRQTN